MTPLSYQFRKKHPKALYSELKARYKLSKGLKKWLQNGYCLGIDEERILTMFHARSQSGTMNGILSDVGCGKTEVHTMGFPYSPITAARIFRHLSKTYQKKSMKNYLKHWKILIFLTLLSLPTKLISQEKQHVQVELVKLHSELENRLGRDIVITSGLRSSKSNKDAGGVSHSAHLKGLAYDIRFPKGVHWRVIVDALQELGVKRIIVYKTHIHYDIDRTKPDVLWLKFRD